MESSEGQAMKVTDYHRSDLASPTKVGLVERLASVYDEYQKNLEHLSMRTMTVRTSYDAPVERPGPEEIGENDLERLILELEKCNRRLSVIAGEIRL